MTIESVFIGLLLVALLGSGVIGGVFFAFSTFVMRALARIEPRAGLTAMQSINVVVINPAFLGVFVGTAVISASTVIVALLRWRSPDSWFAIVGGVLYLLGTFFVTMRCNVPLNNMLAATAPSDPEAQEKWSRYVHRWTNWNHVRTAAAVAAAASFAIALALRHDVRLEGS